MQYPAGARNDRSAKAKTGERSGHFEVRARRPMGPKFLRHTPWTWAQRLAPAVYTSQAIFGGPVFADLAMRKTAWLHRPRRRVASRQGVRAVAGVEAATVALGDRSGDRRRQQQRGRRPSAEVAQAAPRGRRAGHPTNPRQMARVEAAMDVAGNCTARNRPGRLRKRLKVNGRGPRERLEFERMDDSQTGVYFHTQT